jgi:hypothetical protein
MAYFPDLSPYSYGNHHHEGVLHVGWLDNIHPFPRGPGPRAVLEKIKSLAANPAAKHRGYHRCDLCVEPSNLERTFLRHDERIIDPSCEWARWWAARESNGEIRLVAQDVTYAAPVLIVHYIEAHDYLPPAEFLRAVEEAAEWPAPSA